ncbi:MAG: glycogen debranching protein [Pseudonocardiales bacterium]|nr:MAG: glycogen debranching protein [Pseudonocardiales bacterium]
MSTASRLADRRSFVIGDRFYQVGAEDGSYPAEGFHTRGEMGGFWSMPIKLLDGIWFGLDGSWLSAQRYTTGWGYTRMDLGRHGGVQINRTDVAPDGLRAGLIALTLTASQPRSVTLTMDAHSELMLAYPWGETKPTSQLDYNLPDTGGYDAGKLVFRERGAPPAANGRATAHNWAAVVGSTLTPATHQLGPDFRGPQDPAVVCPASGPNAPTQPPRCDDTAYGKGTGGQLTYQLKVPAGSRTVWFAVGGSDRGLGEASAMQRAALAHPAGLLATKVSARQAVAAQTAVTLPGDPQLASSVAWSKQNLADSRQRARDLQLRVTNAGTKYPAPSATLADARWIGAGWPDYPWIFGTDAEYTAFASVASGQFAAIKAHLRTLRQISDKVNSNSGKVVHEVVPDGSVYFGANSDPGNTDETVKFPSTVALVWRWTGDNRFRDSMYDFAVRNLHYVFSQLDADGDGWAEGAGNVERTGMGPEKLDVSVYAIRGLLDLADMAASKGDTATLTWARDKARDLQRRFESTWWNGADTKSYADSLADPGNAQLFQRYWIGVTPVEAELPGGPHATPHPLADLAHAVATVAQHELACYTGTNGLYHTGTGATSDPKGNPGPTCDSAVSAAPSDRSIFTLTTSIMAVAEGALGRMGPGQMGHYTGANARVQMDPSVWESPGDMPEISPSPDFGANIDKLFTERSSGIQAWGTYGVLWPVVHFELGVSPDMGRHSLTVVPQVPDGQTLVAGSNIRLAGGSIDVTARRSGGVLTTTVHRAVAADLTVGALLPTGTHAVSVRLNGHPVAYRMLHTARGTEVVVNAPATLANTRLQVVYH